VKTLASAQGKGRTDIAGAPFPSISLNQALEARPCPGFTIFVGKA
jgi:hypothetical protein